MKLKKFIIIILIFINTINAQNHWTIKGGPNITSFTDIQNKNLISWTFGFDRKIYITENFFLQPEILLSKQGGNFKKQPVWTDDIDLLLASYDIKAVFTYVKIPFFIGYRIVLPNKFIIHTTMGIAYRMAIIDGSRLTNRKIIYDDDNYIHKNNSVFG